MPLTEAAAQLVASGGAEGAGEGAASTRCCAASPAGARCWRRTATCVTVATMLDESGYTEMWKQDKSPEAPGRLENLKELVRALADFETLAGLPRSRRRW